VPSQQAHHERRKARLREEGFGEADIERIHSPIGLDIGARSPEEIALAVLGEMLAVRSGRAAARSESGRPPFTPAAEPAHIRAPPGRVSSRDTRSTRIHPLDQTVHVTCSLWLQSKSGTGRGRGCRGRCSRP